MRALALVALLALGCAGADSVSITTPTDVVPAPAPDLWLPADSPAYDAQLAWGLPLPCTLTVRELPLEELQPACNSPAELAARAPNTRTLGCAERCSISIALELSAEQRAVTLAHELGHILAGTPGHIAPELGCPEGAPGPALMCAGGPASGSPEPTLLDFDFAGAL